MARRISIPFLADILFAENAAEIGALADNPALDRAPTGQGPFVNRLIARRFESLLRIGLVPLPSGRKRDDGARAEIQAALSERLGRDPAATVQEIGAPLDAAADHVAGRASGQAGPIAQTLCGRLFVDDFDATGESWRAARTWAAAIGSRNPLAWIWSSLTGRLASAQTGLRRAANSDMAAIHAIGIAVHNLAESLDRMRRLHADTADPRALDPERAALTCLAAPRNVARQATGPTETPAGALKPGTLVVLEVETARHRALDTGTAFLSDSWSRCPAATLIPVMLAEIWRRAVAEPRHD